jgi:hypothetical protein
VALASGLFACALAVGAFYRSVRFYNVVLLCLILFNLGESFFHVIKTPTLDTSIYTRGASPVRLKQKPNIHLIILESYNSLEIRKIIYGIDNSALETSLDSLKFTVYPRVYSNYRFTVGSVSSIFMMEHHYCRFNLGYSDDGLYRTIIGGITHNPSLEILRANGYRIDYSHFKSSLFQPAPFIEGAIPQRRLQALDVFIGLFKVLDFIFHTKSWSTSLFQYCLYLPEKLLGHPEIPARTRDLRPSFQLYYMGAEHTPEYPGLPESIRSQPGASGSPLWQLYLRGDYWIKEYKNLVMRSDSLLIKTITTLRQTDPNSIIILVGDHGATYNRYRWRGVSNDPNANMRNNHVASEPVTRDVFEVFMAVYWPHQKPVKYFSHVNIFRTVFEVLGGIDFNSERPADESYIFDRISDWPMATPLLFKTASNNQPLQNWVQVNPPEPKEK